jgi:polyisoprenoid-binding protein YceI
MTSPTPAIDDKVRARLSDGSLAGAWHLDAGRSTIELKSKSVWGLVPVKGRFAQVSGEAVISATGEVTGSIRAASASIDTKNKKRDAHLRSADFFDSDAYPDITFSVDRVDLTEEGASAVGTLQVRDRRRPLEVPVSVLATSDDGVELDAEIQIDRSDFGLTWNRLGMVANESTITVRAVFTRNETDRQG